jgi:hypothetical protein
MTARRLAPVALLLALLLSAGRAVSAPPQVPAQMSYQGVLLDASGQPQTGSVDLVVRVYDAISGGTLLYKQTFSGIALVDGIFSLSLGPAGQATDSPADPLTTSFAEALAGDLVATGASRFLEVTVGTEGPLPRTQLLAVPYALQSEHAQQADTAGQADALGTVPSAVLSDIWQHYNFDGGPPNDDPLEGLGDVDGDGIPNFLDPDNDNDGISDADEQAAGTGINAVTPQVSDVQGSHLWTGPTVTVSGTSFLPGLVATLDGETVSPSSFTPASFDVAFGIHPVASYTLQIDNPNGETASWPFNVGSNQGVLIGVFDTSRVTLDAIGAQQVIVSSGSVGRTASIDTDGDGLTDQKISNGGVDDQEAVAWSPSGRAADLTDTYDAAGRKIYLEVDTNGNFVWEPAERVLIETASSLVSAQPYVFAARLTFDASGHAVAGYLRTDPSNRAVVAHDRDGDGTFTGVNEVVEIEPVVTPSPNQGDLAVDASDHVAYVWYDEGTDLVRLAWDRSGDGDFADAGSSSRWRPARPRAAPSPPAPRASP